MTGIEKTLIIIKNHSIKRRIVGRIIQKFEDVGLNIFAIKMLKPTKEQAKRHYIDNKDWKIKIGERVLDKYKNKKDLLKIFKTDKPSEIGNYIYKWSIDQLCKSEVIVMILKGPNAVEKVKAITGSSDPSDADLSTIRGSFSSDSILTSNKSKRALFNVIHRSTDTKDAKREIKVWF